MKRVLSLVMCMALAFGTVLCMPFEANAASSPDLTVGVSHFVYKTDVAPVDDVFAYSDAFFSGSSLEFNKKLALMSMALDITTLAPDINNDPERNPVYTKQLLEDIGFSDIEFSDDYTQLVSQETAVSACAHKIVMDGKKAYTLLVILTRSGTFSDEWYTNLHSFDSADDKGDNAGFRFCKDKVLSFARDYIAKNGLTGDIKVWTTGYSRGAGIINLLGADLIRDPKTALGESVTLSPENLYCYTIGTPRTASVSGDYKDAKFSYIHNVYEDSDIAANFPPASSFDRYGTQYSAGGAYDFSPKKIDTDALKNGEFRLIDDNGSYLPYDQAEYLNSMSETVSAFMKRESATGTDGREGYYSKYQEPVSRFVAWFTKDGFENVSTRLSSDLDSKSMLPMALSMYITFMLDKSIRDGVDVSDQIEMAFNELAGYIETENGKIGNDFKQAAAAYKAVREFAFGRISDSKIGSALYEISLRANTKSKKAMLDVMRNLTAKLYAKNLRTIMEARGDDPSLIDQMAGDSDSMAMSWLFANMLLDNVKQSDRNLFFSFENEQFKQLATVFGNIERFIEPHGYDVIRQYLSDPDTINEVTDAQKAGYRRVYIKTASGASVSGIVKDANGSTVATFAGGKLTSRSDDWIGYTASDDGGWLRLPVDKDYLVDFSLSKDAKINIKVADYSVDEGEVIRTVRNDNTYNWTGLNAKAADQYTLNIPSVEKTGDGYDLTSAYYSLGIKKGSAAVPKLKNVKVKAASRGFTVSWKKLTAAQQKNVTKIQIQYSTSKKFKQYRTVLASKGSSSKKITGLKKGKTYYVRARSIKYSNDKKSASKWSAIKRVKTQ